MFADLAHYIYRRFLQVLCVISPDLNNRVAYFVKNKRLLRLHNPRSFSEKLIFLKLKCYNHDPVVRMCADKYAVRAYITKSGFQRYLNDLLYVYDDADSIDFYALPQRFVLKWNFGAGYNIICPDKDELDIAEAKKQLKKWGKEKYHLYNGELQYKGIRKKIICERFLGDNGGTVPDDYKLYCFNGKVKAIFVMSGRGKELRTMFLSPEWETLGNTDKYKQLERIRKPKCLSEMIEFAESISERFPFVRVDLFVIEDKIYFGELTFTPAGGIYASEMEIDGKSMGDLLDIQRELKHVRSRKNERT